MDERIEETVTETFSEMLEATIGYDVFTLGDDTVSFPLDNIAFIRWLSGDTAAVTLRYPERVTFYLSASDAERLWGVYVRENAAREK